MSFSLASTAPGPFILRDYNVPAFETPEIPLGTPVEAAMSKWNEGRFPTEPGEHKDLPIFNKAEVLIDNGYGQLIPVALTVSLLVEQHLFFGELPIEKISGFKDELSGAIITNAFTIGILDSQEVWDHWSRIASTDELPREPMITMRGLIAFTTS